MDELDKELAALKDATQGVTASQAFKSELLLAAARAGAGASASAAATVTTMSLKLVLAFVAAGAAGGLTVWSLTREPEPPPAPPPAPKVQLAVNIAVTPAAPPAAAPTPSPAVAPAIEPAAPTSGLLPAVTGDGGGEIEAKESCHGVVVQAVPQPLPRAPGLAETIRSHQHLKWDGIVAALVVLPDGHKADELIAGATIDADGWFVAHVTSGKLLWFLLPGFEPVAYQLPSALTDPLYLGAVRFTPLKDSSSAQLAVHVYPPENNVNVALRPEGCPSAVTDTRLRPELITQAGAEPVFNRLTQSPWLVFARAPGYATAFSRVVPARSGRTDVTLSLERARKMTIEYLKGDRKDLCRSAVERVDVVPGEPLEAPELPLVWTTQHNQRVTLERHIKGFYVGNGSLQQYCMHPTFGKWQPDRELRTGDVFFGLVDPTTSVLMRFSVQ